MKHLLYYIQYVPVVGFFYTCFYPKGDYCWNYSWFHFYASMAVQVVFVIALCESWL